VHFPPLGELAANQDHGGFYFCPSVFSSGMINLTLEIPSPISGNSLVLLLNIDALLLGEPYAI